LLQHLAQRFDLPEAAAGIRLRFPEFGSEIASLLLQGELGDEGFDLETEKVLQSALEVECLGKKELGIQRENRDIQTSFDGVMDHHQASALEACADGGSVAKTLASPPKNLRKIGTLEIGSEAADFFRSDGIER